LHRIAKRLLRHAVPDAEDRWTVKDHSDGQLLEAFLGGDTAAFGALMSAHQGTLLRHARAVLGSGGHHEDVVQEVFLKLAQNPPSLPAEVRGDDELERAHLSSWLHKVTRNCCMDAIRSETRRKRREHEVAEQGAALHGGSTDGGIAAVDAKDTRTVVERELGKLPVDQREVLVLRLLADKSYREIADITGKKIGTVGWLVSIGLKSLSLELAPILGGAPADASGDAIGDGSEPRLGLAQGEA